MDRVYIGKGKLSGKGVFSNLHFHKGDVVIKYELKRLTKNEFLELSKTEKNFVHNHRGRFYLYSSPERYVNDLPILIPYKTLKIGVILQ